MYKQSFGNGYMVSTATISYNLDGEVKDTYESIVLSLDPETGKWNSIVKLRSYDSAFDADKGHQELVNKYVLQITEH